VIVPFLPSEKHRVHLQPILDALPELDGEDIALVASYGSLVKAKRRGFRRIVLAQHGAGQSYGGDPRTARNPGYPGGDKNEAVGLFLVPNEWAAWRWQERYPDAFVRVVGCPRLDTVPRRQSEVAGRAVVAIAPHWQGYNCPEWVSALNEYLPAFARLPYTLIGTGHPQRHDLRSRYEPFGIEYVPEFDEVCWGADVLVSDNSSVLFEFAATGRNVVVINARQYRHDVHHGGRFWDWASVGPNVDDPADLADGVQVALSDPWPERELVLEKVYQPVRGGARLAAEAIVEWAA
jgi:hypothetical protein